MLAVMESDKPTPAEIMAWIDADPDKRGAQEAVAWFRPRNPHLNANAVRQIIYRARAGRNLRGPPTKVGPVEYPRAGGEVVQLHDSPPDAPDKSEAAPEPPPTHIMGVPVLTPQQLRVIANGPNRQPGPGKYQKGVPLPEGPYRPHAVDKWTGEPTGKNEDGTPRNPLEDAKDWDRARKIRVAIDGMLSHLALGELTAVDRDKLAATVRTLVSVERDLIESERAAKREAGAVVAPDPSTPEGRAQLLSDLKKLPRALLFEALGMETGRKAE